MKEKEASIPGGRRGKSQRSDKIHSIPFLLPLVLFSYSFFYITRAKERAKEVKEKRKGKKSEVGEGMRDSSKGTALIP